jgi:hypothetical protein
VITVLLIPLVYFVPSIVTLIVSAFTPESVSVTVNAMVGLLFVRVWFAVGDVTVTVGGVVSLTFNLRLSPIVAVLVFTVVVFPASFVLLPSLGSNARTAYKMMWMVR